MKTSVKLREILPDLTPTQRSVYWSYGLHVNKNGVSYRSVKNLAREARRTESMVRIARNALEEMGLVKLIERGGGRGKTSIYSVNHFAYGKDSDKNEQILNPVILNPVILNPLITKAKKGVTPTREQEELEEDIKEKEFLNPEMVLPKYRVH